MPAELKVMVENAAEKEGTSARHWIATLVAKELGFTGEIKKGRQNVGRYAGLTEEQRKEARQAVAKERRAMFSALLDKYTPEQLQELINKAS
jgi:hypothetical protein